MKVILSIYIIIQHFCCTSVCMSPTSSCLWDACLRLTPSHRMTEYSTRERKTSITQVSSQISSAVTELDTGILELKQGAA